MMLSADDDDDDEQSNDVETRRQHRRPKGPLPLRAQLLADHSAPLPATPGGIEWLSPAVHHIQEGRVDAQTQRANALEDAFICIVIAATMLMWITFSPNLKPIFGNIGTLWPHIRFCIALISYFRKHFNAKS